MVPRTVFLSFLSHLWCFYNKTATLQIPSPISLHINIFWCKYLFVIDLISLVFLVLTHCSLPLTSTYIANCFEIYVFSSWPDCSLFIDNITCTQLINVPRIDIFSLWHKLWLVWLVFHLIFIIIIYSGLHANTYLFINNSNAAKFIRTFYYILKYAVLPSS